MTLWAPVSGSAAAPGGSGDIEAVTTSGTSGLAGGGTSGALALSVVRGTGVNQTRHGDDAAYSDARTPLAHVHVGSDLVIGSVAHVLTGDLTVTTTPANLFTVSLPAAGTWLLEGVAIFNTGTLSTQRTLTFDAQCANQTSFLLTRHAAYSSNAPYVTNGKRTAPGTFTFGAQNSLTRTNVYLTGHVVVSAAGVFTIDISQNAETNLVLAGSYLKASRLA